jgi:hypothetical protein
MSLTCKGERGKEAIGFSINKEKHRFIYPLGCLRFYGIILGNIIITILEKKKKNLNLITFILFYFGYITLFLCHRQGRRERGLGGAMAPLGFSNFIPPPCIFFSKQY